MHEMSLAEGILQIIEDHARQHAFTRVSAVYVEVGRLAGVEPDALGFAWEAVRHGSVADGSRLEIIDLPGAGWCMACETTVAMNQVYDPCPQCGGYQVQVTGGTEMRVKELAVD